MSSQSLIQMAHAYLDAEHGLQATTARCHDEIAAATDERNGAYSTLLRAMREEDRDAVALANGVVILYGRSTERPNLSVATGAVIEGCEPAQGGAQ
jgi:hypothetical protein